MIQRLIGDNYIDRYKAKKKIKSDWQADGG